MASEAGKRSVKLRKDDLFLYDTPEIFQGYAPTKNPVSQPLPIHAPRRKPNRSPPNLLREALWIVLCQSLTAFRMCWTGKIGYVSWTKKLKRGC